MATVQDFLTRCFRLAGIFAPGDSIPSDDMNDALSVLNDMNGVFNNEELMIYQILDEYHTLAAQTGANPRPSAITIGSSGATITADRPQKIEAANIVLTSSDPNVEIPLEVLNVQQYAGIPLLNTGTDIPLRLYYVPTWPNGSIYLWPYLNAACKLHLFTWKRLSTALTLATTFTFPDGYNEVMRSNCAVRLCIEWGHPVDPDLRELARTSKAAIMAHNSRPLLQDCDPAVRGSGQNVSQWNYLTGEDNPS